MAKRPRYSRWRRLPGVFRFGEKAPPDPSLEPQRLTLYLNWRQLDAAEALAAQAGGMTIQEYCTELLQQALEAERIRAQVADIEAQRGTLKGLREIADDPEYLAELNAEIQAQARQRSERLRLETPATMLPEAAAEAAPAPKRVAADEQEAEIGAADPKPAPGPRDSGAGEAPAVEPAPASPARRLSAAAEVVLRHASMTQAQTQAGEEVPSFLARLRRGESAVVSEVAELAQALQALERESRDATVMDRQLVYALHRLALEAQVLHTDAWPGIFDEWTIDTVRAVQEAVDRILSGQDIRYYAPRSQPENLS